MQGNKKKSITHNYGKPLKQGKNGKVNFAIKQKMEQFTGNKLQ